jgi:membrane-bound lytic murein transglycosylase D
LGVAPPNSTGVVRGPLPGARDYRRHFGDLPIDPPLRFRERRLQASMGIHVAARSAGTDRDEIARLNPALSSLVIAGRRPIPAGYRLRLPEAGATRADIELARAIVDEEPEERVVRPARVVRAAARVAPRPRTVRSARTRPAVTYRVRSGQTLTHIARKHKVSVSALRTANRLGKQAVLKPGQLLKIPRTAT